MRTLSEIVIARAKTNWETLGLLVAKTHAQLNGCLDDLFTALDLQGIEYVYNKMPPAVWGGTIVYNDYQNVISIKVATGKVAHILTRALQMWKSLSGVNIGWVVCAQGVKKVTQGSPIWTEINMRLRCTLSYSLEIYHEGEDKIPVPPKLSNSPDFEDQQAHTEFLRAVAEGLKEVFPGLGFALFVFEFDKPGRTDYISNADRPTMLQALREGIERLESGKTWSPPLKN